MKTLLQDSPGQALSSVAETPDLWAHAPDGLRRAVQDQAPERLNRHGSRDALRFAVLLSVDSLAFLLARAVLHFFRTQGPLPAVRDIFPAGYLGGLQFAVALLVSLLVVGAYRRGGGWRSPWRWLTAVTLATALALWEPLWTTNVWLVSVQFFATVVLVSLALAVFRGTLAVFVELARERFEVVPRAIPLGRRASIVQAARSPAFSQSSGYRIAHKLLIDGPAANGNAIGAELAGVILATQADAVFVAGTLDDELFKQVIEVANSTGCELITMSRAWQVAGVLPSASGLLRCASDLADAARSQGASARGEARSGYGLLWPRADRCFAAVGAVSDCGQDHVERPFLVPMLAAFQYCTHVAIENCTLGALT